MIVMRRVKIEVNRPKIGDRISFTLKTGEKVEAMAVRELINGTVFCTVDYLDKPYSMNRKGGTRGGYEASDLRKILNGDILDSFPDGIREQLIPFDNGDLLTIPSEREMFGENVRAKEDEGDVMQWEPMEDRRNRIALRDGNVEWGMAAERRAFHGLCYLRRGRLCALLGRVGLSWCSSRFHRKAVSEARHFQVLPGQWLNSGDDKERK